MPQKKNLTPWLFAFGAVLLLVGGWFVHLGQPGGGQSAAIVCSFPRCVSWNKNNDSPRSQAEFRPSPGPPAEYADE